MYNQPIKTNNENSKVVDKVACGIRVISCIYSAIKINYLTNLLLKTTILFKKKCNFVVTVPALHTVRSASGSFFLLSYGN
ncbi:MAG: hypothetical protein RLZZ493_1257 [Bacteroidota bacterium]|jgi:hypothetical protein